MTIERRFRTTVPFYRAGRLDYPQALLDAVAAALLPDGHGRVLDLGCGPGFLALGFAARAAETVAMDPEPEMLAACREAAAAAGVNLTFVAGGSDDLGPHLGRFRLVTMGRSFHWMDRERTLAVLDGLIEPEGGIALFHDDHPDVPENGWRKAWSGVRGNYAPEPPRPPSRPRHEAVLRRSAFNEVNRLTHLYRRRTGIEALINRAFSMSTCSLDALGGRASAFEADLRSALAPYVVEGEVEELVEAETLVATRPKGQR